MTQFLVCFKGKNPVRWVNESLRAFNTGQTCSRVHSYDWHAWQAQTYLNDLQAFPTLGWCKIKPILPTCLMSKGIWITVPTLEGCVIINCCTALSNGTRGRCSERKKSVIKWAEQCQQPVITPIWSKHTGYARLGARQTTTALPFSLEPAY